MIFKRIKRRGQITIQLLIFAAIALVLISGFVMWAVSMLNLSLRAFHRGLAFEVAEAGIEYYRWHLAHDSDDYQDGTGEPGPYTHPYYDKSGNRLGEFILNIETPATGTTVVAIESTGHLDADSTIEKIIKVRMGIPTLARYALLVDDNLFVGSSTNVFGPSHANGGIHFDGLSCNLVSSAQVDYDDPEHSGANEYAVHTHVPPVDPLPPDPLPSRPDVFMVGRNFPVPAVDFDGLTEDLAALKTIAQASGTYIGASGSVGYHLVLKPDDTYDLYKITKMLKKPSGCTPVQGQDDWDTWTIDKETFLSNNQFPESGVIFVEDDAWVDGQINGAKLTIASGRFPENPDTSSNIIINSDLVYTNFDGSDVLGLIAQKNINVGLVSSDDLRIDAALVAKSGRVGRYQYRPGTSQGNGCQPWHIRNSLQTFGMIATNQDIQFSYEDDTGYLTRDFNYDANLLFNPPPHFPEIGTNYAQLSWDEVK